jgi:hypothetical protein
MLKFLWCGRTRLERHLVSIYGAYSGNIDIMKYLKECRVEFHGNSMDTTTVYICFHMVGHGDLLIVCGAVCCLIARLRSLYIIHNTAVHILKVYHITLAAR